MSFYRNTVVGEVGEYLDYYYETYGEYAISFMTFPWVCTPGGTGADTNFLTWPTIQTTGWKCYADNEVEAGYPPYMNFYYGYFGDINNQGNVEDFRLVLSLRQFGPDGQLTYTEDFNEVNFYPVTTDGDSRVW